MKTMIALSLLTAAGLLAQPPGPPPRRGFGPGPGGPGAGFFGGPREMEMAHPVTGAPFSAVETSTETQVLPDGNTIQHTRTTKVSRDAEGRFRVETTEPRRGPNAQTGATVTHVTISDPVGHVIREIDNESKTVHEMVVRTPPNGQGRGPVRSLTAATVPPTPT